MAIKETRGFPRMIKDKPDMPVWDIICGGKPPRNWTLREAVAAYKKDPIMKTDTWRHGKAGAVARILSPLLDVLIHTITPRQIEKCFKKKTGTPETKNVISCLNALLRFLRDGQVVGVHSPHETSPTNGSSNVIGIAQRQIISHEEALDLIHQSRGKHVQFREQLAHELSKLGPGQSYAFVPKLTSKDSADIKNDIDQLKAAITNTFMKMRLNFKKYYISSKNLFIIMPAPKKGA